MMDTMFYRRLRQTETKYINQKTEFTLLYECGGGGMKDTEGERTKNLSQEMEGVKDEPVQEEREWRTQKDSQERWVSMS